MALSKDRLRKMHGIPEPTGSADPAVLARRRFHETAAKWLARWSYPLQAAFALIGCVVVLLPTLSKNWRSVIENTPVAARIFHDFSTLSGWAMVLFFVLMAMFLIWNGLRSRLPAGRNSFLTNRDIVEMELYPRNKKEEFIYWVDFGFAVTGTTLWLFLPFGVLAFFIRIGG